MDPGSFVLPANYDYVLTSVNQENSENGFNISFNCSISTKEEVTAWIREFQEIHNVQWRIAKTFRMSGLRTIFRIIYRCQHGCRYTPKENSKRKSKNTSCSASVSLIIKRFSESSKRSDEEKRHPCVVNLNNVHNHSLLFEEALKYRAVSPETKQTIIEMFQKGYSPSMAYQEFKNNIMELYQDDFCRVEKDRSIIPEMSYFYNLLYAEKRKEKVKKWKTFYKRKNSLLTSECENQTRAKRLKTNGGEAASGRCLEPENEEVESQGALDANDCAATSSLAFTAETADIVVPNEETTVISFESINKTTVLSDVNSIVQQSDSLKQSIYCKELLESVKKQLCRICGTKQDNLYPIFCEEDATNGDDLTVSKKIAMYLPLQISKDDKLPLNICTKCLDLVESWHEIHVSCLAADSVLRTMFNADECIDESDCQKEEHRLQKENDPSEENMLEKIPSFSAEESCEFNNMFTIKSYANGEREVSISENLNEDYQAIEVESGVADDEQLLESSGNKLSCNGNAAFLPEKLSPRTEKDLPIYSCKHCGEDLLQKEEYVFHKQQCAAKPTVCDVCGESVPQRREFKKHFIKHFRKQNQRTCICEKCGKELSSRHKLQMHMNSVHSDKAKPTKVRSESKEIVSQSCQTVEEQFCSSIACL